MVMRYDGAMVGATSIIQGPRGDCFDVICAGEPRWRAAKDPRASAATVVGAGLLNIARVLALKQVHVGLATVVEDDRLGRTSLAQFAALGMDVGGVKLASPVTDFVMVDGTGRHSFVFSECGVAQDLEIPAAWSSQVLLLSGLSAVTSRLAAFCKAARRARRDGTVIVLDVVGSSRHWAGRDPRVISMVLREADVVRCSFLDLAAIGMDSSDVRRALRSNATLVINDDNGATAIGTFGEVRVQGPREPISPEDFAERCTAAICAELARPQRVAETPSGRWHRILRHAATMRVDSGPFMQQPARRAQF